MDNLDRLIASAVKPVTKPADLDRHIVMALAQQTLKRAHRRNRQTLIVSVVSCVVLAALVLWIGLTFIPENFIWPQSVGAMIVEFAMNFSPERAMLLAGVCMATFVLLLGVSIYSYKREWR